MAFSPVIDDHTADEGRLHSVQNVDIPGFSFVTARSANEISPLTSPDMKTTLQRRFTSESVGSPTGLNVFEHPGLQRGLTGISEMDKHHQLVSNQDPDMVSKLLTAIQLEQTKYEHDVLSEQKRKVLAEVHALEIQQRKKAQEIRELSGIRGRNEPVTPPEHRDGTYRAPNLSILATPPSMPRHDTQQLMTPPSDEILHSKSLGARSVTDGRLHSDDNEDQFSEPVPSRHRSSIRNSIASAVISRPTVAQLSGNMGSGINTTDFLFADEENPVRNQDPTSPDVNNYLKMSAEDNKFPVLVCRDSSSGLLSASSAALDLAMTQKEEPQQPQNTWAHFRGHKAGQHSLPFVQYPYTPPATATGKPNVAQSDVPNTFGRFQRGSVDLSYLNYAENNKFAMHDGMPKLQSSFSTSDLPTMRNLANYGRIPMMERHRRESSTSDLTGLSHPASAMSFGPPIAATYASMPAVITPPGISPLPSPGIYGYGPVGPVFHAAPFGAYPVFAQPAPQPIKQEAVPQLQSVPARPMQKRNHEAANRFANVNLETLVGEIYGLCKDQHGCRFLQKKLEENNPHYTQIIFRETQQHVVELMTDPFGNYLCQKLLEYANDEQRTILVNNAAPELVKIALNQHGTRALQKMIEYISTRSQIETVVNSLKSTVVELIQDLNGNHVVQKCLNKLSSEDAQFIYDAVGAHCVAVGTHRHGCCVLQRCIDHASPSQKVALINQITANAIHLVQDPFGNYVVQYILDLGEPKLAEPLVRRFLGKVCSLSKQKFSSNVIEKCIRVSEPATKKALIEEMINQTELEKLLRDSFANYVIQTALEYAEPAVRHQLVENIKPLLPAIRMTPYGRRIQSKIQVLTSTQQPQAAVPVQQSFDMRPPAFTGAPRVSLPYATAATAPMRAAIPHQFAGNAYREMGNAYFA